jgi:hypothetical protein
MRIVHDAKLYMSACKWVAIFLMPMLFVLSAGSQEEIKPREVTAFNALDQIQTVLVTDGIEKHPPAETLWLIKQIVLLNNMQISEYELKQDAAEKPDYKAPFKDPQEDTFNQLRVSICKQRPYLRIVDLDGRIKPCP